jgi:predicted hotdog family 3-hydroxylacyl-ACP dehydratase
MAASGKKVLVFTADGDVLDTGLRKISILGARLVAGSGADATAKIRMDNSAGDVLYSMAAAQKTSDDTAIAVNSESGKLYISLTGAGAEVYVYLE